MTIHPVPTDNYLYVRSDDDDMQDATFECFDVQGRQVVLQRGNFKYKEWSVDVSAIPSGMYFLRAKSGKDNQALKFIKNQTIYLMDWILGSNTSKKVRLIPRFRDKASQKSAASLQLKK